MVLIKVIITRSKGRTLKKAHIDEKCESLTSIKSAEVYDATIETSFLGDHMKICGCYRCTFKYAEITAEQKYLAEINTLKLEVENLKNEVNKITVQNIILENKLNTKISKLYQQI